MFTVTLAKSRWWTEDTRASILNIETHVRKCTLKGGTAVCSLRLRCRQTSSQAGKANIAGVLEAGCPLHGNQDSNTVRSDEHGTRIATLRTGVQHGDRDSNMAHGSLIWWPGVQHGYPGHHVRGPVAMLGSSMRHVGLPCAMLVSVPCWTPGHRVGVQVAM